MNAPVAFGRGPSVIARLVLGYSILLAVSFLALATVFYIGTIGVLDRSTDRKITAVAARLAASYQPAHPEQLAAAISRELSDGADSDSEIVVALAGDASRIAGNVAAIAERSTPTGQLTTRKVIRNGVPRRTRLLATRLPDGGVLLVGRDLSEQQTIQSMVWQALAAGAAVAIVLGMAGALLFRNQIRRRIGDIRVTAKGIEAGDLTRRIPASGDDEFGLLSHDINRMLDRIEQLMSGVRHVSNAIAHDLRTPLNRIRAKLDDSLHSAATAESLTESAQGAIAEIDELTLLFEKLLHIAEAESGMRTQQFELVDLSRIAFDMVELRCHCRRMRQRPAPRAGQRGAGARRSQPAGERRRQPGRQRHQAWRTRHHHRRARVPGRRRRDDRSTRQRPGHSWRRTGQGHRTILSARPQPQPPGQWTWTVDCRRDRDVAQRPAATRSRQGTNCPPFVASIARAFRARRTGRKLSVRRLCRSHSVR